VGPDPRADGLSQADIERLDETGELISTAERRSMMAERDTADRYLAAFLADRVGTELAGRISAWRSSGLFVKLDESGADGSCRCGPWATSSSASTHGEER
jgi:ribonuclease R